MTNPAPALCRDCLADTVGERTCARCGSARIVRHAELGALTLAHIDCDAFYASIEKRDDPSLAGKPVIVGGSGGRGVVTTACYVARKFGVRSAMPMFRALRLCPGATVIRPDMAKYAAVSRQVREVFLSATPLVEAVSLDEAYLDLAGTAAVHGRGAAAELAATSLRIEREIGITVSIGLSWNRFLAKLASELDKPRGFGVIGRAEALAVLAPRPVRAIPGVGPKLDARLAEAGFRTIGDLQRAGPARLRAAFGERGLWLAERAAGRGGAIVEPERETKAISAETTFAHDLVGAKALAPTLWRLCERVAARAKRAGLAGTCVTLKLKRADFRVFTRRRMLAHPTQLAETIWQVARTLLEENAGTAAWRLIGVGIADLTAAAQVVQPDLFESGPARPPDALERAVDSLRSRFGADAIGRGRVWPVPAGTARPDPED